MLDAKDVARKVATGCGHTAAVVLPCAGCIEAQMRAWESSVREAAKAELLAEFRQMSDERNQAVSESLRLKEAKDGLVASLSRLKDENTRLTVLLKEEREKVSGLSAQLLAEQGMKHAVRLHKAAAR